MTAATIEIWANGALKPGATPESVTANLQRLFPSATQEQRARFLAGKPFRITTVTDQASAHRAVSALEAAGVATVQRAITPSIIPPSPGPTTTESSHPPSQPSPQPTTPFPEAPRPLVTPSPARSNAPAASSPSMASLPKTTHTAENDHPYATYEPEEKPSLISVLSRALDFAFAGGATWKHAAGVILVGVFMNSGGQNGKHPILAALGLMVMLWGVAMLILRRAPLPPGFKEQLDRIAKETGDNQLFSTKKEMHHLPAILSSTEKLLAFCSGFMNGNTWLIALTDRRVIFLDKGLFYGLKQITIDLDKVNAVSGGTGLVFGEIFIEDNASQRKIKNVPRGSVMKFTNKVQDAIEARKQLLVPGGSRPTDVSTQLAQLASLHDKGLLTPAEFNQQKAKLLAGN